MHLTQDDNTVSNPALLRVSKLSIHDETGHCLVKDLSFDVYPAQTVATWEKVGLVNQLCFGFWDCYLII